MNGEDPKKQPPDAQPAAPASGGSSGNGTGNGNGSGKGAETAYQAMLRKRRLAELPDPSDTVPPAPSTP